MYCNSYFRSGRISHQKARDLGNCTVVDTVDKPSLTHCVGEGFPKLWHLSRLPLLAAHRPGVDPRYNRQRLAVIRALGYPPWSARHTSPY